RLNPIEAASPLHQGSPCSGVAPRPVSVDGARRRLPRSSRIPNVVAADHSLAHGSHIAKLRRRGIPGKEVATPPVNNGLAIDDLEATWVEVVASNLGEQPRSLASSHACASPILGGRGSKRDGRCSWRCSDEHRAVDGEYDLCSRYFLEGAGVE